MSFLVVENLDDSDQFILGCDFVRNFDVMIDLNNGLIRTRNPDRQYVKRPRENRPLHLGIDAVFELTSNSSAKKYERGNVAKNLIGF